MSSSFPSRSVREIRDAIRAGTRTVEQTVQQPFAGLGALPLGVQLIVASQCDAALLSLAEWVEGRAGWSAAVASRSGRLSCVQQVSRDHANP